jgi:hypothetical protein
VTGAAHEDCRGDLLAQARRAALTGAGRLALDAHLAACASCRMARDVGDDFDAVDVVDVRDGARVRALADVARAGAGAGRRRARGHRPWAAAAAALLLAGGSASAAVWLWKRPAPEARAPAPIAAPSARAAHARVTTVAPVPEPAAAAEPPPQPQPQPPRRAAPLAATDRPRSSAAELLAAASAARGQGEMERATTIYRKLQRDHAGSPEAVVSMVPLGRLLLAGGAPRAALAQFDAYLRASERGPLVAEALYGKGQACALLDDRGAERQTWRRLLADQPDSPYAPHARNRLAVLGP